MSSLKCGLVGLPNVGKSSLFNALTDSKAAAENYPYCTIDPNVGEIPIPEPALDKLAAVTGAEKIVPSQLRVVDVAGLITGASKGEGMGNKFLSHLRETTAIIQVVRCFEDDNVIHIEGNIDPIRDINIINLELIYSDLERIERAIHKLAPKVRTGEREARATEAVLKKAAESLESSNRLITSMNDEDMIALKTFDFLTAKPMLYVANCAEAGPDENADMVEDFANKDGAGFLSLSVALENELITIPKGEERETMAREMNWEGSGLPRLLKVAKSMLKMQEFFTAGPKEVRAWPIPVGTSAAEAAGTIHTDMQRGFIKAEVVSLQDFLDCAGLTQARSEGKVRLEGRDYIMREDDVALFHFNV